ncbi:hypothetical protein LUZ63_019269 [Rhynchospora breviuscula]|uniref:KIB1-4 beta-propeller domain-containing protein n=1 Tax=Rhynchospora breviuscula TaxID=2022672 RepID=A0A9Q0C5W7_9POAL|nr:hypothetical protein LUZ63_019269 [Rhynchospora breviuscula]
MLACSIHLLGNNTTCLLFLPITSTSRHAYLIEPTETFTATFAVMQMELVWKATVDYDPSDRSDFKVVIVYGKYRRLAFWRPGDLRWNLIKGVCSYMDDVLFSDGKLYAVTSLPDNILCVVDDWSDPKLTEVNISIPKDPDIICVSYLVDLRGELLLVQRFRECNMADEQHHTTIDNIQVQKIDVDEEVSVTCKHIEGYAFFLGVNLPVIIDPRKFPSCRKNAIYLTDTSYAQNAEKYGRDDLWIYDMDTCTLSRYYPPHIYIPDVAAPIWFNPNPW